MANGQYTIPGGFSEPAPQPITQTQQTESPFVQPVAQPETPLFVEPIVAAEQLATPERTYGRYHFVKETEDHLDSYRYTAIEIEEAKPKGLLAAAKLLMMTPKPAMSDLIEKEKEIGGRLLKKENQTHELGFWSDHHEWFFWWDDGKTKDPENSTIHYQVFEDFIIKSFQGRVAPFADGEEARFLSAVTAYENAVRHELYPFDEALVELSSKDDFNVAA